jgi:endonuclease YncB( thermonuclease family)
MTTACIPQRGWQPPFFGLMLGAMLLIVLAFVAHAAPPKLSPVPDPAFTSPQVAAMLKAFECPPRGFTVDGTVVRVIDGDTVVVRSQIEYHIRLLDCWAPESRTRDLAQKQRGLAAKARMQELAIDKPCRVFMPAGGTVGDMITMGRILGRVWILQDGATTDTDLSSIMVSEGHATTSKESKP